MKQGIHPEYVECTVRCSCGNVFKTRSTKSEITVELVVAQCKEAAEMRVKLVRGVCAVRLEAPALADVAIFEQADGGLGVAYVNREEHGCPFAVAA